MPPLHAPTLLAEWVCQQNILRFASMLLQEDHLDRELLAKLLTAEQQRLEQARRDIYEDAPGDHSDVGAA